MKYASLITRKFRRNWITICSIALVLFGVAVGYRPFGEHFFNKQPAGISFNASAASASVVPKSTPTQQVVSGHPVRLQIPSLGFDLSIIDGVYNSKSRTWNLTTNKVQYATITPEPNNVSGNTFMYGHNRREVFEFLYKIRPGAQVLVITNNEHVFTYEYVGAHTTSPSDASLFNYQGPSILTLQTCSGPTYQYRQLFTFKFVSVN